MSSANVRSTDAIRDFRFTLVNFSEEARSALTSVEMEIRQVGNWLERDQLSFWRAQVKRYEEAVAIARSELHRKKLSAGNSDAVSDTEQKENLRDAQRRLAEAEDKVARIKRWIPVLDKAVAEYHSASQPLGDRLAGAFVSTINLIDKTIASLEAYLATTAPTMSMSEPSRGSGTSSSAASKSEAPATASAGDPPAKAPVSTPAPAEKSEPAAGEPSPADEKAEVGAETK